MSDSLQPHGLQHVLHHLLEFAQTHVHWVGDAIQLFHRLLSPSPFVFNVSQHQGLLQLVGSLYQVAKVLELLLQKQHIQNSLLESKTYPKFPWKFKLHSSSSKESPGNYKSCSKWSLIQPAEFTLMLQMAPCLSWVGCTGHCGCSFGCSSWVAPTWLMYIKGTADARTCVVDVSQHLCPGCPDAMPDGGALQSAPGMLAPRPQSCRYPHPDALSQRLWLCCFSSPRHPSFLP